MFRTGLCSLAALTIVLASTAFAQSAVSEGQAQGQADARAAHGLATAEADARAAAEARAKIEEIKKKGATISAEKRAEAEAKMKAAVERAEQEGRTNGDMKVATRLAMEFGVTAEHLLAEKQALGASWGQILIAYSLAANSTTELTAAQLIHLHQEGTGWGQIAAGLGLRLGDAVSAVRAESRVAAGLARADGRVATIRGEGARVNAGAGAAARAGGTNVGATAGVGVGAGVRIKP